MGHISYRTSLFDTQRQERFSGISFFLYGFDPDTRDRASRRLFYAGAVDAGACSPDCTHVIVDNTVEYDDPVCVTARRDGKILVSEMWLNHSLEVGRPVLTDLVMYMPRRNLKGIPGAQSLVVSLNEYPIDDRDNLILMVQLMGAKFTRPLRADTVTHLVCYKFEGQKYELATSNKTIKLVNHKWLEDCLRKWEIVPEKDYSKSGYELEMELEMEMELEAPRSLSNTIASRGFSIGAGIPRSSYSCSMLMRFCQQLESNKAAGTNSKSVKRKSLGKNASFDEERPQKNYRETRLDTKVDKSDTGVAVTVMQGPVLTNSVVFVPPRNGILGAQSLVICLTGYRGEDKMKIILMVQLMGAKCTLLLDDTVTHLMCYKFEGKKYEAAERKKTIKLVNHKWLEDCLRNWEIVTEKDYSKSGQECNLEAAALRV